MARWPSAIVSIVIGVGQLSKLLPPPIAHVHPFVQYNAFQLSAFQ